MVPLFAYFYFDMELITGFGIGIFEVEFEFGINIIDPQTSPRVKCDFIIMSRAKRLVDIIQVCNSAILRELTQKG